MSGSIVRIGGVLCGLLLFAGTLCQGVDAATWFEGWETASGTYVPDSLIDADAGYWYLGDTVSEFPECGVTPHTAEVIDYSGSRALRLTSNNSFSECADNVWVEFADFSPYNSGFSIPITPQTVISFEETGQLANPQDGSGMCIFPPCFDNISLTLIDNRGHILFYVLQRPAGVQPDVGNPYYGELYTEVFLNPGAGTYSRNVFNDFSTISQFNPTGAYITSIALDVDEHGWAIIDNLRVTDSLAFPQASFTCAPDMPMVGGLLEFDASASSDPDGHVVLYEWDWGDGETDHVTVPTITHVYPCVPDVYTVTLTVTDNDGFTDSASTDLDLRLENGDILLCRSYQSFVPGEWTHAGIYNKELNRVIEARPEGVDDYALDDWSWLADNTWVRALRVDTAQTIRDNAVAFATSQRGAEYDWFLALGKQAGGTGPLESKWYCSELVWAGYYNASGHEIDLDSWRWFASIAPSEIEQSPWTYVVAEHLETRPDTIYTDPFGGSAFSPVDIIITDPDGLILSKTVNEISGARYEEGDVTYDGEPDDLFCIPEPKEGTYLIEVVPEAGASPDDTYTLTVMFGPRSQTLATDVAIQDIPPAGYQVKVPFPIVPVYRFWSPANKRHFYTTSETEKNKLINNYSHVWTYEGTAYFALPSAGDADCRPVYRFWSSPLKAHFYTIKESEKNKLITQFSDVWQYEGVAFYAYPEGLEPAGTSPVYRFWSSRLKCHFYTISATERDKLINNFSSTWQYEGVAWYAYE